MLPVGEYFVDRMVRGGARMICFVIAYVIQRQTHGLCNAIFYALPVVHLDEVVVVGLPDTVWFPEDALAERPGDWCGGLNTDARNSRMSISG